MTPHLGRRTTLGLVACSCFSAFTYSALADQSLYLTLHANAFQYTSETGHVAVPFIDLNYPEVQTSLPLKGTSVTENGLAAASGNTRFGYFSTSQKGYSSYDGNKRQGRSAVEFFMGDTVTVNAPGRTGESGYIRGVAEIAGPLLPSNFQVSGPQQFVAAYELFLGVGFRPDSPATDRGYHRVDFHSHPFDGVSEHHLKLKVNDQSLAQAITSEKTPFTFGQPFPINMNLRISGSMAEYDLNFSSNGNYRLGTPSNPYTVQWKRLDVYNSGGQLINTFTASSLSGFNYKAVPPKIGITRPASRSVTVTEDQYRIKGTLTDDVALGQLTYVLDRPGTATDRTGTVTLSGTSNKSKTWNLLVPTKAKGTYKVYFTAKDAVGNTSKTSVEIIRKDAPAAMNLLRAFFQRGAP